MKGKKKYTSGPVAKSRRSHEDDPFSESVPDSTKWHFWACLSLPASFSHFSIWSSWAAGQCWHLTSYSPPFQPFCFLLLRWWLILTQGTQRAARLGGGASAFKRVTAINFPDKTLLLTIPTPGSDYYITFLTAPRYREAERICYMYKPEQHREWCLKALGV